jgi:hypothetical protein
MTNPDATCKRHKPQNKKPKNKLSPKQSQVLLLSPLNGKKFCLNYQMIQRANPLENDMPWFTGGLLEDAFL